MAAPTNIQMRWLSEAEGIAQRPAQVVAENGADADTRADKARAGQSSADQLRGCGIHVKSPFQIL